MDTETYSVVSNVQHLKVTQSVNYKC